jgi:hypothetical protein
LNRIDQITCNDSIPIIKVYKDTITHIFNINLNCWNDGIIYDYSQNNVLIIHNDSIEKRLTNPWVNLKYHLDDIEAILKKDLTNKGSDPNLSVSPAKLILHISVSENRLELLHVIFSKLADAIENQTLDMEFRIWITDYLPYFIPPEPPSPNNN